MTIQLASGVVIHHIPDEMQVVLDILSKLGDLFEESVTITGAAQDWYPEGKVHRAGYAFDLRVWNMKDPEKFVEALRERLGKESKHYVVLWKDNDKDHEDHIHVGYAYAYSKEYRRILAR